MSEPKIINQIILRLLYLYGMMSAKSIMTHGVMHLNKLKSDHIGADVNLR